jgi:hypothetical protein
MNAPRINRKPTRSAAASLRLLALLFLVAVVVPLLALHAGNPAWWANWGVLTPGAQPNDYAAVNQGQVKSIASLATQDFDAQLPGGAGAAVHAITDPWNTPSATTNDYQAINLGQLKNLAKPFYDRLIAVGYTNEYPWAVSSTPAKDFAAANIGQVKNLFSFDLTADNPANDSTGDGVADWWAKYYFGTVHITPGNQAARGDGLTILQAFQQGLNPNDFYNGQIPTFTIISGNNQTAGAGGFVSQALAVQVVVSGQPAANAPVTFTATQGGGQVQAGLTTSPANSVQVKTNVSGIARSFFQLPSTINTTCQVTAVTGTGANQQTLTFTENSGDNTFAVQTAACSISGLTCSLQDDGSQIFTWSNNTDDPTPIWNHDANGNVVQVTTVPAGQTSYQFTP